MKRFLLFGLFIVLFSRAGGQPLSIKDFCSISSYSFKKFDSYLSKRKYSAIGRWWQDDTVVRKYSLKQKVKDGADSLETRIIETYEKGSSFSFSWLTSSFNDLMTGKKELKEQGFFCGNEEDPAAGVYLYQKKNISVLVSEVLGEDSLYAFRFQTKVLPLAAKIHYAEDLLAFTSHQYLISVFEEKNVLKDIYYFSDTAISKCSVLFPHTQWQAVFIWNDEVNLCDLSYIVLGGNIATPSSANYNEVVAENAWASKTGIYSGMSLRNLARLNGSDFRFYGRNSSSPFLIIPDNRGKIDFKKNGVVLSCSNPNGSPLLNNAIVSAGEAIDESPGLFVFLIMIFPRFRDR